MKRLEVTKLYNEVNNKIVINIVENKRRLCIVQN